MPDATENSGPIRDDYGYLAPMFVMLAFTAVAGHSHAWFPYGYLGKIIVPAILLVLFWRCYTRIVWSHEFLAVALGVVGTVQWIGMQLLLQRWFPDTFAPTLNAAFNPVERFGDGTPLFWIFVTFRWIVGATLVVPIVEELFWRDFGWRSIIAPNNFKLAQVGERDWKAVVGIALLFSTVHGNWGLTAIVWALMIAGLLLYTKSIGACILMHATTNFLLGAYVLATRDWSFW